MIPKMTILCSDNAVSCIQTKCGYLVYIFYKNKSISNSFTQISLNVSLFKENFT